MPRFQNLRVPEAWIIFRKHPVFHLFFSVAWHNSVRFLYRNRTSSEPLLFASGSGLSGVTLCHRTLHAIPQEFLT